MKRLYNVIFSTLAGAALTLALTSVQAANNQEIEFNEGSHGGVEIKFRNGCWISYDRYAKRGGNAGYCSPPQYQQADEAAQEYLNTSGSSPNSPVPESQMERYCQGEASGELGTRPNNIAIYGLDKRGSDFVVTGQSPRSGYNITEFECVFGKRGMWKGFHVTDRGGSSGGGSHSDPVPESQMERYCQGEASGELGTRPNNISTESVHKRGKDFVVSGQSPQSGYNVTTFECVYGKRGMWKGFHVTGRGQDSGHSSGGHSSGSIPYASKERCLDMFGVPADVRTVNALRPGYWEVIIDEKGGGHRSVACTIDDDGEIQEWTELN